MEEQDMKAVQIVSPNNLQVIDVEKPSIDEKNQCYDQNDRSRYLRI